MAETPAGRSPSQPQVPIGEPETAPSQHTPNPGPVAPSIQLAAGQRPLPEYELVECLGRGGFGEVWKAKGPGGFLVALKFIRLADAGSRVELRALELMKEISHPHLLVQFGAWQLNDFLIVAMELAKGTLADQLKQAQAAGEQGIPRKELMVYLFEAARGLDYLHSLKVQHRDVKPQNLMLVGGGVKVADFGLARVLEHSLASATGAMTPAYAAPELFENRVSEHTDQYALAISYCELRGGRRPFDGPLASIMVGHLRLPPDLSMLPKAEHAVVARALAKKPSERWPSCRAFVEALLQAGKQQQATELAPQPQSVPKPQSPVVSQTEPPPPLREAPVLPGWGQHLTLALGTVLLAGLLVIGGIVTWSTRWHRGYDVVVEKKPQPPWVVKTIKNSLGMEFALVPRGSFWMGGGGGTPGEKQVEIPYDFYLGVYEVTQEEWQAVMGKNPSSFSRSGDYKDFVATISDADLKRFPVESVSWKEAQEFITKLNAREKDGGWLYRLPRELEWEYACRGGASSKEDCSFHFYLDQPANDLTSGQANFNDHRLSRRVGSYRPNRLGIYDLHGSVAEWCEDLYGRGPQQVFRGGSWATPAWKCHAAYSAGATPNLGGNGLGLRLARVPPGR